MRHYPSIHGTKIFFIVCVLILQTKAQIFVATNGNDANSGSIESPFASIPAALSVMQTGDTIFVRGGTYMLTATISITASQSGIDSLKNCLFAWQDEVPVLNFTNQAFGGKGIRLYADYWHFYGLNVKGAGDNGLHISGGSYNRIEKCNFYENRDTGLQLDAGASHNQCINCDSYFNADPTDYGDADGFAPKLDVGTGNYFYGCRSWGNCDDGWDGYLRGASDIATTLENCWTWGNGYLKDGTDPGTQANGNGFKMGGGDDSNADMLMHHHYLINCAAFNNKGKGFDQNNNAGSMTLLNCTGYQNSTANYKIKRALSTGQTLTVKNCISYSGSAELGSFAAESRNSWQSPFIVSADDFLSLTDSLAAAPRQSDGSLPEMDFLHLARGSDLIDSGVDVGQSWFGSAPDLGAFESNYSGNEIESDRNIKDFLLAQNYPNPFNPTTTIDYELPDNGRVRLTVYDLTGREITKLVEAFQTAGKYSLTWDAGNQASGIYLYRLETDHISITRKLLLQK